MLIDSPLAPSVVEAQELTQAADAADMRLMVSQPKRFAPEYAAVKQSLDQGKLGEPGLLRMHRWESPRDLRFALETSHARARSGLLAFSVATE